MNKRWMLALTAAVGVGLLTVPLLMKPRPAPEAAVESEAPSLTSASSPSCKGGDAKKLETFTLKDMNGAQVRLADYKGKVVLLNFWATWCGPCKVEIPHFIEFQEKYGPEGLQVVGLSVDDTPDLLTPYIRDMKMNYPVLQGLHRDDVQDAYGPIVGIPVSVLISRDAKICATHTGLTGKDVFEREIKALL